MNGTLPANMGQRSDLDPDYCRHYRELCEKHWWWRVREEILLEELHRLFPDSRPLAILDVGCGDGLFFERLRQFGNVEGIESETALVDPRGLTRNWITVAAFDASFNPEKKYDLILMLDVLKYRTRLTKRSFCLLASSTGMEIIEMRYFFIWLFAAKLAARMAESILPREPRIPRIPTSAINGFLYQARAKEILTRRMRVPFGGSLLAVGRRTSEEKSLNCAATT